MDIDQIMMSPNGGWCVFAMGFIMLFISVYTLYYLVKGIQVSMMRGRIFNKEFMEQFRSELECDPPLGGAPDCGNGPFSDKLAYKDWFNFNKAIRTHANMQESISVFVLMPTICVVIFPTQAIIFACVLLIGRVI